MFSYSADFLAASNIESDKVEALKKSYLILAANIEYFRQQLVIQGLEIARHNLNAQSTAAEFSELEKLTDDYKLLLSIFNTLKSYVSEIRYSQSALLKNNRMNREDIGVLELQADNLCKIRALLDAENTLQVPQNTLSQLITNAGKCAYQISATRIWARRALFLIGGLIAMSMMIALISASIIPGVNFLAAIVLVPIAICAALAFMKMHSPVFISESANFDGMSIHSQIHPPMTLAIPAAGVFGLMKYRKLPITKKPREFAARNLQIATMNKLASALKKKINDLELPEIKEFLSNVFDVAQNMYQTGGNSLFHELRTSKMKKAHCILSKVAEIIEMDRMPTTIEALLDDTSFRKLLDAKLLNAKYRSKFLSTKPDGINLCLISEPKMV